MYTTQLEVIQLLLCGNTKLNVQNGNLMRHVLQTFVHYVSDTSEVYLKRIICSIRAVPCPFYGYQSFVVEKLYSRR